MGLRERLRRTDWLGELQTVLLIGLLLGVAGLVAGVGLGLRGPLAVEVPSDHVVTADALTGLRDGAGLDENGVIYLSVADPSPAQLLLSLLAALPTWLVGMTMLVMLLQVVRHARRNDPFTAVTVRRLRLLSVVVLVGGPLAWIAESVAELALVDTVTLAGPGTTVSLAPPLMWILVGFGYLAVAEIVNRGCGMRAELDGVI